MKLSALNEAFEKKYSLDSLIDEDLQYQQTIQDDKTNDVVTITGSSQADLSNKVKKFKSAHGGINRYSDIVSQKQNGNTIQDKEDLSAEVDDALNINK